MDWDAHRTVVGDLWGNSDGCQRTGGGGTSVVNSRECGATAELYSAHSVPFLFPNGRFVPSWTRIVALLWSPLFLLGTLLLPPDAIVVPLFASILVSLCAQVYRYRSVSTAVQRSQTKWVVFATAISFLGAIGLIAAGNLLPLAQEPGSLGYLIGNTGLYIFGSLIPLAIGVAILRAHLWDIDVLINKALVYGLLTAFLGAMYIGLTIGLESLAAVITGHKQQQQIVIVVSTLVIAALFQPFRRRIQQLIDRRFYRHKYTPPRRLPPSAPHYAGNRLERIADARAEHRH